MLFGLAACIAAALFGAAALLTGVLFGLADLTRAQAEMLEAEASARMWLLADDDEPQVH